MQWKGVGRVIEDPVFWISWKSLNWDIGQKMFPALFAMLGGDLKKWEGLKGPGKESKEVLAGSQFRVFINNHEEQTS